MPPIPRETSKNGRFAASEQRHPRAGSGPARAHLFCAGPRRFRDRHERVEVRRLRVRDGAQSVGQRAAAGLSAIHAQPRADRQGRARSAGDADGPHPGERRRDGAMAGQAGPRHRLLRRRVPAYLHCRGSGQRGWRLPLSENEERLALRAGRHPRRRPDGCGPLLGHRPAGVLPEGRRLAAQPARRDFLHPADRGHPRRRKPRRHA